ncbi:MAG: MoaD/ThiS family protein [Geminicoccaceae bacterium]
MNDNVLGHNSEGIAVTIEARLFNSLSHYAPEGTCFQRISLPAGSTVGDLVKQLSIPLREVFLVLRNGKDVTPSLYGRINTDTVIDEGDVIALSGPVPYSWGYGAPVV